MLSLTCRNLYSKIITLASTDDTFLWQQNKESDKFEDFKFNFHLRDPKLVGEMEGHNYHSTSDSSSSEHKEVNNKRGKSKKKVKI